MSIVRTELERLCETEQRLLNTIAKAESILSKVDYVAMMTEVDIPTEDNDDTQSKI